MRRARWGEGAELPWLPVMPGVHQPERSWKPALVGLFWTLLCIGRIDYITGHWRLSFPSLKWGRVDTERSNPPITLGSSCDQPPSIGNKVTLIDITTDTLSLSPLGKFQRFLELCAGNRTKTKYIFPIINHNTTLHSLLALVSLPSCSQQTEPSVCLYPQAGAQRGKTAVPVLSAVGTRQGRGAHLSRGRLCRGAAGSGQRARTSPHVRKYMTPPVFADAMEGSQTSAGEPDVKGTSGQSCCRKALATEATRDTQRRPVRS